MKLKNFGGDDWDWHEASEHIPSAAQDALDAALKDAKAHGHDEAIMTSWANPRHLVTGEEVKDAWFFVVKLDGGYSGIFVTTDPKLGKHPKAHLS